MANNYLQFSVAVEALTDEERQWLERLSVALDDRPDTLTNDDLAWIAFEEKHSDEIVAVVKSCAYDIDGDVSYYGTFGFELGGWRIYAEESGDTEVTAHLIKAFLKQFRPSETVELSWAETCSKMRPGEFGGGACLITADWIYWPQNHIGVIAELYTKTKEAGKSLTLEQVLQAVGATVPLEQVLKALGVTK